MMSRVLAPWQRALLVLVLALSLVLRLTALDAFVTSDEDNWYRRSLAFLQSLERGDLAHTLQSGHPGVITMWVGVAAHEMEWLFPIWRAANDHLRVLFRNPPPAPGTGLPPLTIIGRALVGLLTWFAIVIHYPLLRRLFGAQVAFVAAILVALDPFFLAHSRFHHLDALLTAFTALSVTCLLVYRFRGQRRIYLVASGAAAGLALANKSPAVLLIPWVGIALLLPGLHEFRYKPRQGLRQWLMEGATWAAACILALFACWPALWVQPLATLSQVFGSAQGYAENPHLHSNFFWFAIRPDPGLAFYPVAWTFRTTPWVILGLILAVTLWRRHAERLGVGLMAGAALLFAVAMTIGAKKFDRYLLPVFPLLDCVAAVGYVGALQLILDGRRGLATKIIPAGLGLGLVIGQWALTWPTRPYYISYYNPIFGGGRVAKRVLLVGWGEGLDRVAAYLNSKPDADALIVGSWHINELASFFRGNVVPIADNRPAAEPDYYVLYSNVLQRDLVPAVSAALLEGQPDYRVDLNGIEYAWVYRNTIYERAEREILAHIGVASDPCQTVLILDANAAFARRGDSPVPVQLLQGPARHDVVLTALQHATAGYRHIWHLVYPDAVTELSVMITMHLQEVGTIAEQVESDGVRAIRYDLPPEPHFVPLQMPNPSGVRFGTSIRLLGYSLSATNLVPGQPLSIRFLWQAEAPVERSYTVFTHLVQTGDQKFGQLDCIPQGGLCPTNTWQVGERIIDDRILDVVPDAPPGEYTLLVGMYDSETLEPVPVYDPQGNPLANRLLGLIGLRVGDPVRP